MSQTGLLRVLIAGPSGSRRLSLRDRVRACPGVVVCAEAADGQAALRVAQEGRPDLCLLADEPGFDSTGLVQALARAAPQMKVVLAGAEPDDEALLSAVAAGASGYVASGIDGQRLADALLDVVSGRPVFPMRLGPLLITRLREEPGGA